MEGEERWKRVCVREREEVECSEWSDSRISVYKDGKECTNMSIPTSKKMLLHLYEYCVRDA